MDPFGDAGDQPSWDDDPAPAGPPRWARATATGVVVVFGVPLLLVPIYSLTYAGPGPSILYVSALAIAGIAIRWKLRSNVGTILLVAAVAAAAVLWGTWGEMIETDRAVARLEEEACSDPLPEETTLVSCEGQLYRGNGAECPYGVDLVVSSPLGPADLHERLTTLRFLHDTAARRPTFEVLETGTRTVMQLSAVAGTVREWRCG